MQKTMLQYVLGLGLCSLPLMWLSSCADQVEYQAAKIDLSTHSLHFGKNADAQRISLSVNRQQWTATSPKENQWLWLTPKEKELIVRVAPNPTGQVRSSYILVDAGTAVEKISISQAAADSLQGFPDNVIALPQQGGESTIAVPAALQNYRLLKAESAEWVQVIAKQNKLKFITQPNREVSPRSVQLTVAVGDSIIQLKARQAGVALFVLACNPGDPFDLSKMMRFEHERGSLLTEYGETDPSLDLYEESYFFRTTSPLFKDVVYVHDTQNFVPTRIYTRSLTAEGVKAVNSDEFKNFVAAQGYVQDAKDPSVYINEKEKYKMTIDVRPENNSVVLFFDQIFTQPQAYPTFERLELGPLHLLQKKQQKVEQVVAHEDSLGNDFTGTKRNVSNELEALSFNTKTTPLVNRTYYFYTSEGTTQREMLRSVEQYSLNYSNPNLGVWKRGKYWYITQEFEALLKNNGFEFFESSGKYQVYGRRSDRVVLAISGDTFQDVNNNEPVLQVSVLYKPRLFELNKLQAAKIVAEQVRKATAKP